MEAEEGCSGSRREAIDRKGKAIVEDKDEEEDLDEEDLEAGKMVIVGEIEEIEEQDPPETSKAKENIEEPLIVGEKESIKNLISGYKENSTQAKKIKILARSYAEFRRVQNDDDLFYGAFLFAYVEHIWMTQDRPEVERLTASLTLCKWTNDIRGNPCEKFEEYREKFVRLLYEHIEEDSMPRSLDEFLMRNRSQWPSTSVCSLLRHIASNESARQAAEILASPQTNYDMVHDIVGGGRPSIPYQRPLSTVSDALGVAVRVVFLDEQVDRLRRPKVYHEEYSPSNAWRVPGWCRQRFPPDFISPEEMERTMQAALGVPTRREPSVILLFRPTTQANHFDILYPNSLPKLP